MIAQTKNEVILFFTNMNIISKYFLIINEFNNMLYLIIIIESKYFFLCWF